MAKFFGGKIFKGKIFEIFFCLFLPESKNEQKKISAIFFRKNGGHFETDGHFEKIFSSRTPIIIRHHLIKFEVDSTNGI